MMSELENLLRRYDPTMPLDEEDALFEEIRAQAAADREAFIAAVRDMPLEPDSPIGAVYEALSAEATAWREFFLEELDRLLDLTTASDEPEPILSLLDEFYALGLYEGDRLVTQVRDRLERRLAHPHPAVRHKCVELLDMFLEPADLPLFDKLAEMARSDADWRVRHAAHRTLSETWPERARQVKLPLWIRLRARIG